MAVSRAVLPLLAALGAPASALTLDLRAGSFHPPTQEMMAPYGITAYAKADAPGVYVDDAKIASLGLRVRKGCNFHGLALNVNMDLSPF